MNQMIESDSDSALYCPYCGYDLRAISQPSCPECGGAVDEASLKAAEVPWQSRKEIGRLRAFIRTAGRVTFRTKRFCYAVGRPVSYPHARRFQFWVVTLFWLSLLLIVASPVVMNLDDVSSTFDRWGWGLSLGYVLCGAVGLWLFLFFATGLHTYWLHPRHLSVERQNRAVALGYYACGPLVLSALGSLPFIAGIAYGSTYEGYGTLVQDFTVIGLVGLGWIMIVVGVTAVWRICFVMAGRVADRGPVGRWSLPLVQPALVALLALLLPVGLPALLLYLSVIVRTF